MYFWNIKRLINNSEIIGPGINGGMVILPTVSVNVGMRSKILSVGVEFHLIDQSGQRFLCLLIGQLNATLPTDKIFERTFKEIPELSINCLIPKWRSNCHIKKVFKKCIFIH